MDPPVMEKIKLNPEEKPKPTYSKWRIFKRGAQEKRIRHDFEQALASYSLDKARGAIAELMREELLNAKDIAALEQRVRDNTDEGMYQRFLGCRREERRGLAEDYARVYPKGEHKQEMIRESLIADVSILVDYLDINPDFRQTCDHVIELNRRLVRHADGDISLAGVIPLESIKEQAEAYLVEDRVHIPIPYRSLRTGHRVKVITPRYGPRKYLEERDANFPIGSVGTVITVSYFQGGYYPVVRFDEAKECEWTKNWELSGYWQGGRKNAAKYCVGELGTPLNSLQIQRFRHEIACFEKNLSSYGFEAGQTE